MIPPSRAHLQALAGWSLSARANCSDQQHLALCHFGDACGELSTVIGDVPQPVQSPRLAQPPACTDHHPVEIPAVARQVLGVPLDGPCTHRFDIRTQLCHYCGLSYRKAHGRPAELM